MLPGKIMNRILKSIHKLQKQTYAERWIELVLTVNKLKYRSPDNYHLTYIALYIGMPPGRGHV